MIVQPHCIETHHYSASNNEYGLIRHFVPRMGMLAIYSNFFLIVVANQGHSSLCLPVMSDHISRHVVITAGWKMQQAFPG